MKRGTSHAISLPKKKNLYDIMENHHLIKDLLFVTDIRKLIL